MINIIFIEQDGVQRDVQGKAGQSLMQAAVDNGIDAILAECGGACACATCHCYIDDAWIEKVEPASELEKEMLDCVSEPKAGSRLSCQIEITDQLDGMVVRLPESQY